MIVNSAYEIKIIIYNYSIISCSKRSNFFSFVNLFTFSLEFKYPSATWGPDIMISPSLLFIIFFECVWFNEILILGGSVAEDLSKNDSSDNYNFGQLDINHINR